jgi:MinD superfamily P-loop ATPase
VFPNPEDLSGVPLVTFLGARGGLGTSTLAAAVAAEAAATHPVALLDGAPRNNLELLVTPDDHDGPDWHALERMCEQSVTPLVPRSADRALTVVAWSTPAAVTVATVEWTLKALEREHALVIADAGTGASEIERALLSRSSAIVLLVPGELRPLTQAVHLVPSLTAIASVHLVACRPSPSGISDDHLADLLNLPIAATFDRDGRLPIRGEHAQLPTRSLRATARQVMSALGL